MDSISAAELVEALRAISPPVWVVYVSAAANVVLAGTAVWALLFAWIKVEQMREHTSLADKQLEAAREQVTAAREQAKQARAARLAEIDRDFETTIAESRSELKKFIHEIDQRLEADETYKRKTDEEKARIRKTKCNDDLHKMREEGSSRYVNITAIIGFFETVGWFIKQDYLDFDDVYNLYCGSILFVDDALGEHIEWEKDDYRKRGQPDGLYENLCSLIARTKEHKA